MEDETSCDVRYNVECRSLRGPNDQCVTSGLKGPAPLQATRFIETWLWNRIKLKAAYSYLRLKQQTEMELGEVKIGG